MRVVAEEKSQECPCVSGLGGREYSPRHSLTRRPQLVSVPQSEDAWSGRVEVRAPGAAMWVPRARQASSSTVVIKGGWLLASEESR
jgi:hypothetical protein